MKSAIPQCSSTTMITAVALWCLVAPLTAAGVADGHLHNAGAAAPVVVDPCADLAQPASLRCALAPSALFAADGRLWLAWAHSGHVYVNHSTDRGQTFSEPVAVNATPEKIAAHGENRPKLALGKQGEVYVSWTQSLTQRYTGHIRFARSVDGGKSFSTPVIVNDDRAEISHRFEALSVDGQGNVLLAWLDKRDQERARQIGKPYLGAALYYTWSDDQGESFKPNRKLLDNSCECCRVVVDNDAAGLPVILWRHVFGDNIRDHALISFSDVGEPGEFVRASFDDWKVEACPHHGPALSIDDSDVYHLTWFSNSARHQGLFYANSKDQGRSFTVPLGFGGRDTQAGHAHVLAQGAHVIIVWQDFDGIQSRLRSMQSADGGVTWSAEQTVAQSSGDTDYPFLLASADAVYVAWQTRAEGFRLLPIAEVSAAVQP